MWNRTPRVEPDYCDGVTISRFFRRATLVVGIVLVVAFLPVVAEGKGKARAAAGKPNILLFLSTTCATRA
jgi:hypothetical protein